MAKTIGASIIIPYDRKKLNDFLISKSRARITGTVYTSSELLDMIYDWIETEGSFLSTYNGRVRLWIDPNVPLRILSFFEPEPAVNSKEGE